MKTSRSPAALWLSALLVLSPLAAGAPPKEPTAAVAEVVATPVQPTIAHITGGFIIPGLGPTLKLTVRQGELNVDDVISVHHFDGVATEVKVTRLDPAPLQAGQEGYAGVTLDPALAQEMQYGAVLASPSALISSRRVRADIRVFRTGPAPVSDPERVAEIVKIAESLDLEGIEVSAAGDRPRHFSTGFTPEVQFHGYKAYGAFTFAEGDPVIGGPSVPAEIELSRFEATRVGATFQIDAHGGVVGEGVVTELLP